MKNENLISAAELNALLTPEEREQLGAKEAFVSGDDKFGSARISEKTSEETTAALNHEVIARLQEDVSALTLRVESLEHQLQQQAEELEAQRLQQSAVMEAAAAHASTTIETPPTPEPGTFSRIESYGRNRKKKKSILQKLLD